MTLNILIKIIPKYDGTKIKMYTNATNISRTSLKDRTSDPIDSIESSAQVEIKRQKS